MESTDNNDEKKSEDLVSGAKILEVHHVNSIINNGGSYFLIDLPVCEDGVVYCWEYVDLELLKTKISSGWLTPKVPNKEIISKHHLAGWEIESSNWYYTKDNYYDFILSIVKSMNPNLTNLFSSKIQSIENRHHNIYTASKEQRIDNSYKRKREHYLFKKSDGVYWLANFYIYSNGSILIDGIGNSLTFKNKTELESLLKDGIIATEIPDNSVIIIQSLGEIKIAKTLYCADVYEKFSEIDDIINRLNGNPTSSDECWKMYEEYTKNPTEENKDNLKKMYEKIPTHLRKYVLGDMDVKDGPIRNIIYG